MQSFNAIKVTQLLLTARLKSARCVVDATAGRGNDTLFMAKLTPMNSTVWAFDIQQEAIEKTQQLISNAGLCDKVKLIKDSHENINKYVNQPIDVCMFNLGYLPGGDHDLTTTSEATLAAISIILQQLTVSGIIAVVAYPGHPQGFVENKSLKEYLTKLPSNMYTVSSWYMANHEQNPPVVYLIEKVRSEVRERSSSC